MKLTRKVMTMMAQSKKLNHNRGMNQNWSLFICKEFSNGENLNLSLTGFDLVRLD